MDATYLSRNESVVLMTAAILISSVVLALLGLNAALAVWFILRLVAGPFPALVGFGVVLTSTAYCLVQLAGI